MLSCFSPVWLFATPRLSPTRLLCPWDSPGKNTGGVAMPSSRGSSWPRDRTHISHLLHWQAGSLPLVSPGKPNPWGWWFSHYVVSPWTIARQAPLFTGFPRQEYWSGLSFPSPGNLPDRGIKPGSPALQAYSLPTELPGLLYGHITSQAVGICLVILWPLLFLLLPSTFHSNGNQSIGDFVLLRCLRE